MMRCARRWLHTWVAREALAAHLEALLALRQGLIRIIIVLVDF
jgi:hypothetical protein